MVPMSTSRQRREVSADDPLQADRHAERISPEEFGRLVKGFYGTKTVIFDRPFAKSRDLLVSIAHRGGRFRLHDGKARGRGRNL
jgi:hypothetical protein